MSDTTFITNEGEDTLENNIKIFLKNTKQFSCSVGYFYSSGFFKIYKNLEDVKEIKILIGINTNKQVFDMLSSAKKESQMKLDASTSEMKKEIDNSIVQEYENSNDNPEVENGVRKFIEWIISGKLKIKASPNQDVHGKIYIFTSKGGGFGDEGRVITGSSNFTDSGLNRQNETNKVDKRKEDYEWALNYFNKLWESGIDVSERFVHTIKTRTWMNDEITPYHLFLKFLYEFLQEKINLDREKMYDDKTRGNYMNLKYQKDAVRDAKLKLEEFGGVFLSDVVGLGKTFIAALLAQELDGETLVIAPPVLLDKDNLGSWPNVFLRMGVKTADYESIGKLDKILRRGVDDFKNIIIDESHRFRTEGTQMYSNLFKICRGKRVILVSATPLNNKPEDILSQIKLFQNVHKSTLPNPHVRDLEKYFRSLHNKLEGLSRVEDKDEYLRVIQENAKEIRNNILRHIMVRRTRKIIMKYYEKDLKTQGLRFPEVDDPKPVIYRFDEKTDNVFNETLQLIIKEFKYSRYTPLLYLKKDIHHLSQPEDLSQKNMRKFMKVLLLKRLESSFFAFKQSVERFIYSYRKFIELYDKDKKVFVSKENISKIFEFIDNDNDESIQKLIDDKKAYEYSSNDFTPEFISDLKNDLKLLEKIQEMWLNIKKDPKLDSFIKILKKDKNLKNKVVVFTESKETANYLEKKLNTEFENKVIAFSSFSSIETRNKVIENFDANAKNQSDEFRILVSTEILSEGVNLHRSNVVVNYDIPWNPTRMMQRVGRINRVDTKFNKIYTYNFFPADPINKNIELTEAAESKIKAFIEMLGNDARLLTDEEIKSHDLFMKLASKKTLEGEDEEDDKELEYLIYLRDIRDNNPELFETLKRLPKKARTGREVAQKGTSVFTFFRKGKLRKIFFNNGKDVEELDFAKAAELLNCKDDAKPKRISHEFYGMLEENKTRFDEVFEDEKDVKISGGRNVEAKIIKRLKAIEKETEIKENGEHEDFVHKVLQLAVSGGLDKGTIKAILEKTRKEINPLKILAILKSEIHPNMLKEHFVSSANTEGPKEVILSEFLIGD